MHSRVGFSNLYESGDQSHSKSTSTTSSEFAKEELQNSKPRDLADKRDERATKKKLNAADQLSRDREDHSEAGDPRAAAVRNGNIPSKGARIDAELMRDDNEELGRKADAKMQQKKKGGATQKGG